MDLIQHGLGLLKKDESFVVLFLGDEVNCRLIEFINDNRDLILFKI